MERRYRVGLVVSASLVLLAYKCLSVPLQSLPSITGAWLLEAAVLCSLWALLEVAENGLKGWPRKALILGFYVALYSWTLVCIAHTFFFESAAERRISLLELDLGTLGFFFTQVLPLRGLLWMLGLLSAIHLLARPIARRAERAASQLRLCLWLVWPCILLQLACGQRPASPIADVAADLWEQLTTVDITIDSSRPSPYAASQLDKSAPPALTAAPHFKKVLVFVMETMTQAVLDTQRRELSPESFVNHAPDKAHVFSRYYATNQDSRTGMLSMLGSRFIPFEAYTEAGRDHYLKLGARASLVDHLKTLGYRSAFAVSQQEVELVVSDLHWDEKIHLAPADIEQQAREKLLCFVPYEFEHSCEDRALLPRVLDFIDKNERVFLYQEFIWGHASEYNKASGRTNTDYYSAYLDAVVAHLKQTGAIDDTLIVLTSDHGFRDKALQSDRAMYQLPLLFYATRFTGAIDAGLRSHLDFKDLLLHELLPDAPTPPENPFLMIIGPTGTSFLTVLTQPGEMLLMKARPDERYLLHHEGYASGAQGLRAAGEYLRLFDDYLAYFAAL